MSPRSISFHSLRIHRCLHTFDCHSLTCIPSCNCTCSYRRSCSISDRRFRDVRRTRQYRCTSGDYQNPYASRDRTRNRMSLGYSRTSSCGCICAFGTRQCRRNRQWKCSVRIRYRKFWARICRIRRLSRRFQWHCKDRVHIRRFLKYLKTF